MDTESHHDDVEKEERKIDGNKNKGSFRIL